MSMRMRPYGSSSKVHYLTTLLSALLSTPTPTHAAQIHAHLLAANLLTQPLLLTQLISLYAASGHLHRALLTFHAHLPHSNIFTYTTLISHLSHPLPLLSFSLFSRTLSSSALRPSPHTFSAVLPACANLSNAASCGCQVHACATKLGSDCDVFVSTALADLYAKCGDMAASKQVFGEMPHRNVVSWNALIVGYVKNRLHGEAMRTFRELIMRGREVQLDQVSLSSTLSACAGSGALAFGRQVHAYVVKVGMGLSLACVNNALLNMYTKCGCSQEALKLLAAASCRDAITWNIVMLGCVQDDRFEEACAQFRSMIRDGVLPDEASFATALHASACLAAWAQGATIHTLAVKTGFLDSRDLGSSLITMYSKCGRLEDAYRVFDAVKKHLYVVSWTAMITALQQHGHGGHAIELFETMLERGIAPDHVTLVSVLAACSHNGLVEQGRKYFDSMRQVHKITPGGEHYACMVDMLGRAGRLAEAKQFIDQMPVEPDASVLGALLAACRNCRELELGKEVATKLFEMEPGNPGNYVLLANMYASHGRLEEAREVRRLMGSQDARKETVCSWIDIKNKTYVFPVVQQSHHPRTEEMHEILRKMEELVKQEAASVG